MVSPNFYYCYDYPGYGNSRFGLYWFDPGCPLANRERGGSRRGIWRVKRNDFWQQRRGEFLEQTDDGHGDRVYDDLTDPRLFRGTKTVRYDFRQPSVINSPGWNRSAQTGGRAGGAAASPGSARRYGGYSARDTPNTVTDLRGWRNRQTR